LTLAVNQTSPHTKLRRSVPKAAVGKVKISVLQSSPQPKSSIRTVSTT